MKYVVSFLITIFSLSSLAVSDSGTYTACEKADSSSSITVSYRITAMSPTRKERFIDLDLTGFKPKDQTVVDLMTQIYKVQTNLMVMDKIDVPWNEVAASIKNPDDYANNGMTDVVDVFYTSAFATDPKELSPPAFMVNIVTQEKGAMGLSLGIQPGGGIKIDRNKLVFDAFKGSTLNCK